MKLVHTADWHLGKYLYGRSLVPDQEYFLFRQFLPWLEELRPGLVLLAGDVFDRQVAPVEAVRLFDRFLTAIHGMGIPLALAAGNHDGAERMAVGAGLLRESGVYIAGRPEDVFQPAIIRGGNREVHVYLLPYCEPPQIRGVLGVQEGLRTFTEAYSALLDRVREAMDPAALNILVAHCFVTGASVSASESPVYVGGGGEVSASCFQGFDYVALGHLHAPQKAGENGRYSGSPLKYSFDEARQRKSVTVLSLEGGGLVREEKTFPPLHDLRVLSGSFQELFENVAPSEDYVCAELLDDGPVYMPMDRLRPKFPNLLTLNSLWLGRAAGEAGELREQLLQHRADDGGIFRQFLSQICGEEATPREEKLFLQALGKAPEDAEKGGRPE